MYTLIQASRKNKQTYENASCLVDFKLLHYLVQLIAIFHDEIKNISKFIHFSNFRINFIEIKSFITKILLFIFNR